MRALILGSPRRFAESAVAPLCAAAGMECKTFHPPAHDILRGRGPALSRREYQARFGDDIDFAAVALILAEVRDGYAARTFLELDSPLYDRLRGVAAEVDQVMADFRPDIVLTSGALSVAQIHLAKARRHNAAPLFWGTVIPGGAFILDRRAPYNIPRVNSLDTEWNDMPSSEADRARGADYVKQWRAARQTRPEYDESPGEVRRLESFLRDDDRPTLLLALQVVADLNVLHHLPPAFDGDYPAWANAVLAAVPPDWKVVVKKHPRTWYAPRLTAPNHFAADRVELHRLLNRCDATLTLASNVGMEAALAGIPSLVCGRPFYAGKKITTDFAGETVDDYAKHFGEFLSGALKHSPPPGALDCFAHRALLDYHCWPGEAAKLRAVAEKARDCPSDVLGDPRRPFLEFYPQRMRRYVDLVNEFASLGLSRPTPGEWAQRWWRRRRHAWTRSLRKRLRI